MLRASDAFPQLPGTARSVIAPYRGFAVRPDGLRADGGSRMPPAYIKERTAPLARNMNIIPKYFSFVRFENQIMLWFRGQSHSRRDWSMEKKMQFALIAKVSLNT